MHHLVHHLLLHLVPHLLETQESVEQGVIYFIILETWQEAAVVYCSVGAAEDRKASAPPTPVHTSIPSNCCTATAGQGKRRGQRRRRPTASPPASPPASSTSRTVCSGRSTAPSRSRENLSRASCMGTRYRVTWSRGPGCLLPSGTTSRMTGAADTSTLAGPKTKTTHIFAASYPLYRPPPHARFATCPAALCPVHLASFAMSQSRSRPFKSTACLQQLDLQRVCHRGEWPTPHHLPWDLPPG